MAFDLKSQRQEDEHEPEEIAPDWRSGWTPG
jgi:hypothetical protein